MRTVFLVIMSYHLVYTPTLTCLWYSMPMLSVLTRMAIMIPRLKYLLSTILVSRSLKPVHARTATRRHAAIPRRRLRPRPPLSSAPLRAKTGGSRVVVWVWLRPPALLGVRRRRLAAVAAHEGGQDGGVVHAAVQPAQQRPHAALGVAGHVAAAAAHGERLHLQSLPRWPRLPVRHADGVLPPVAEATVLVLVVLQQVVDRPQPRRAAGARADAAPAGAVAAAAAVTAAAVGSYDTLTLTLTPGVLTLTLTLTPGGPDPDPGGS
ncbi:hypothetical protein EYF80_052671 [Liparis tanakae]|uniref:Uncharacterized protein n=1 Tax=Liparis tanakae TaxID=230148 RepID=A0A4Z2F7P6_9TELE|nr:hypothetical protein EYF80_052671 [Liparis tanakae]